MKKSRKRLDIIVFEMGLAESRQRAQALIMSGKVLLNGGPVDKPGTLVRENDNIVLAGKDIPYVSRGGLKLEKAIEAYRINVSGLICLDAGASTGGFTDCLLQHGAKRVYAVDVGYGQLAWKLRKDPRVIVIERTNIRNFPPSALPHQVDVITIDVSFISLKIVVPAVMDFLKDDGFIVALIKPQFEIGRGKVGKGGVVREPALHNDVISDITNFFRDHELAISPVIPSPILGPKGNKEFLVKLTRQYSNL